ncbi:MAG: Proline-tRNA ligase, partial [Parcubacteria group bacterium GW2011_GWA2_51_12]
VMGSYGIGLGRVMATAVEVHHDERGIIWPKSIAPFMVHLVELGGKSREVRKEAEMTYETLLKEKIEVLYDDRDTSAGEKFADSDLIGIPYRVVVSEKTAQAGKLELKGRGDKDSALISLSDLTKKLKNERT